MKERLVARLAERLRAVESGDAVVVGVNRFAEGEPSPLTGDLGRGLSFVERIEHQHEVERIEGLRAWRAGRNQHEVSAALDELRRAAEDPATNLMDVSIRAAGAGTTTGEWAGALREVFGEYRAPTGVSGLAVGTEASSLDGAREAVRDAAARLGVSRVRMLVAKPGLDGHSNAAEQIAVRARDAGFEVVYQGIRLSPAQIARAAVEEDVHVVGISILSGAHNLLVPDVLERLRREGVDPSKVPVIVGGIIPDDDAQELREQGVARVYTPKDRDLTAMIEEIAGLLGSATPAR
jgi:ethylmalonyl-CoA mutase